LLAEHSYDTVDGIYTTAIQLDDRAARCESAKKQGYVLIVQRAARLLAIASKSGFLRPTKWDDLLGFPLSTQKIDDVAAEQQCGIVSFSLNHIGAAAHSGGSGDCLSSSTHTRTPSKAEEAVRRYAAATRASSHGGGLLATPPLSRGGCAAGAGRDIEAARKHNPTANPGAAPASASDVPLALAPDAAGGEANVPPADEALATDSPGEGALATIVSGEGAIASGEQGEASATVTSVEEALATVQDSIGSYLDVHKENAFNSALHEPARSVPVSVFGRVNASDRARFDGSGCVHFYHRIVGWCADTTLSARIRTAHLNSKTILKHGYLTIDPNACILSTGAGTTSTRATRITCEITQTCTV
jgi:hypothetical protein